MLPEVPVRLDARFWCCCILVSPYQYGARGGRAPGCEVLVFVAVLRVRTSMVPEVPFRLGASFCFF